MLNYLSIGQLVELAEKKNLKLSQVILEDQAKALGISEEQLFNRMRENWSVMHKAIEEGLKGEVRSFSGLVGGSAKRMKDALEADKLIGGGVLNKAVARALAVAEVNAAMGKIVAAPTAGSCGILPSVIETVAERLGSTDHQKVMALIAASGIGMVIAKIASVSGAQGGCQAECGSAAGMAAVAAVELAGGSPSQCAEACAISLKNILGLVCDPVAGLVEVPCVKRNASGAATAIMAADMALAGIKSTIPVDEVVTAMKEVGDALPLSLKETALGGLANTPTARRIQEEFFGSKG